MADDLRARFEQEFQRNGWLAEIGEDPAGHIYPPHRHGWTRLVTLGGSLRLRVDGGAWREFKRGDTCDIATNQLHEAVAGSDGWHWLAAWKPEEDDTFAAHA